MTLSQNSQFHLDFSKMTSCAIANSSCPSTIQAKQHLPPYVFTQQHEHHCPNKPFSLNRTGSEAISGMNKRKQGNVASCSSSKTHN